MTIASECMNQKEKQVKNFMEDILHTLKQNDEGLIKLSEESALKLKYNLNVECD
jgi:hypothetical protein